MRKAPDLGALEFTSDQSALDPLLREAGQQLESMLAGFINVSIAEDVHEMRFDTASLIWKEHREQFRYLVRTRPFVESRMKVHAENATQLGFLVSGGFMSLLGDLLPENQKQVRFRYLGRTAERNAKALVIAFAEKDGEREGLAWLDEPSKRIVRIRIDFLKTADGQEFRSFTQDIRFVPVIFSATEPSLWLPARATLDVRFAGGELHTVHRFSDYRLEEFASSVGHSPESVPMLDDQIEASLKSSAVAAAASAQPVGESGTMQPLFMPAQEPDTTIKVNVRQVLVPVVVTDKDGHHITALTRADFKVFEDGVEQKIIAFASERADVAASRNPQAVQAREPATAPKLLPKQHAFVICLDQMHSSFANSVHIREALRKLFQQEQAGDSQYVLIALGRKMEIIQNTTSDPAQILEKLSDANFHKTFTPIQQSSSQMDMSNYERDLQEARAACDAHDPNCQGLMMPLPGRARELAGQERLDVTQILAELRSVVEQMAHGNGRRTMILISDGFSLRAGQTSFTLLDAYFPQFRSGLSVESMQNTVQPIFKLAVKANVPIYTIDSRGLYTSPGLDASRTVNPSVAVEVNRALAGIAIDSGLTLSEIAAATGGTFFQNSNDLLAGLQRAFADGREYYMLAYVSGNGALDGKFRKIEVRVQAKNAVVNAKRGYWANPQ